MVAAPMFRACHEPRLANGSAARGSMGVPGRSSEQDDSVAVGLAGRWRGRGPGGCGAQEAGFLEGRAGRRLPAEAVAPVLTVSIGRGCMRMKTIPH